LRMFIFLILSIQRESFWRNWIWNC
jgi:hypothetical protein